jgi:hypothetical protein
METKAPVSGEYKGQLPDLSMAGTWVTSRYVFAVDFVSF